MRGGEMVAKTLLCLIFSSAGVTICVVLVLLIGANAVFTLIRNFRDNIINELGTFRLTEERIGYNNKSGCELVAEDVYKVETSILPSIALQRKSRSPRRRSHSRSRSRSRSARRSRSDSRDRR